MPDLSFLQKKGSRLSTSRIIKNLKTAMEKRDLVPLAQAHEEILVHIQGRIKDKRRLKSAVERSKTLWFYMAAKGWLPDETMTFRRGLK